MATVVYVRIVRRILIVISTGSLRILVVFGMDWAFVSGIRILNPGLHFCILVLVLDDGMASYFACSVHWICDQ